MPSEMALVYSAKVLLALSSELGVEALGTVFWGCPEQSSRGKVLQ